MTDRPTIPAQWHPEWQCSRCDDANACYDEGECLAEMDDEEDLDAIGAGDELDILDDEDLPL